MIGTSARPLSVSAYSTRGGTSGNVWRSTMPSSSSARRRSERVRGLMPCSERSSSQNRERPSARSRTSNSVHLPQMMSAVRQTGQLASAMSNTLPTEAPGPGRGRRGAPASGGDAAGVGDAVALGLGLVEILHRRAALAVGGEEELEVVRARRGGKGLADVDAARLNVLVQR